MKSKSKAPTNRPQKQKGYATGNSWDGYYLEDMDDCRFCLYYAGKKKGCTQDTCCCEEEKREAAKSGRIKRKRSAEQWVM
jgi:hypothetical protein